MVIVEGTVAIEKLDGLGKGPFDYFHLHIDGQLAPPSDTMVTVGDGHNGRLICEFRAGGRARVPQMRDERTRTEAKVARDQIMIVITVKRMNSGASGWVGLVSP